MHYYLYRAKGWHSSFSHLGSAKLVQSEVPQDISTKGFLHPTFSTLFLLIIIVVNLLLQLALN